MDKTYHVLLVDDEVDLLESIAEDLELEGFSVVQAKNGKVALDILTKNVEVKEQFDAIVSDIAMPVMDGLTMISELRKQGISIPVLFLSGYADKEKAVEALKNGAMDMLDKPYDRNHFIQAVTRAAMFGVEMQKLESAFAIALEKAGVTKEQHEKTMSMYRDMVRLKTFAKPTRQIS